MLGDRLRALRLERGMDRQELAAMTTLSTTSLRFLETNRRPCPGLTTLAVLAAAFDMTIDELIGGADNILLNERQRALIEARRAG